jgi:hypothetical protein
MKPLTPFAQVDLLQLRRCQARFMAREAQQLLHQMAAPVQPFVHLGQRLCARFVAARALHQLQLQLQRGQRRTQFMRRVGHKGALRTQRDLELSHQRIQRQDHRTQFRRHRFGIERLQRGRRLAADRLRKPVQRPQRAPHHGQDQHAKDDRKHQQRRARAQRHAGGQRIARGHRLRHLDVTPLVREPIQAPWLAIHHDIRIAMRLVARQVRQPCRSNRVHKRPMFIPRLQDECFLGIVRAGKAALRRKLIRQGGGKLAQLQVGQLIGFGEQGVIQQGAGAHNARQRGAQQPNQQLVAYGFHGTAGIL